MRGRVHILAAFQTTKRLNTPEKGRELGEILAGVGTRFCPEFWTVNERNKFPLSPDKIVEQVAPPTG
jgi:hypothetical protein